MMADETSLERMHDIVLPDPVPAWPPAPGWYALLALLIASCVWFAFRQWRAWRADAFRREALGDLSAATTVSAVSSVLRRVALVGHRRRDIAKLSGEAWVGWLRQQTSSEMSEVVAEELACGAYRRSSRRASNQVDEVRDFASAWIRAQRPAADFETKGP